MDYEMGDEIYQNVEPKTIALHDSWDDYRHPSKPEPGREPTSAPISAKTEKTKKVPIIVLLVLITIVAGALGVVTVLCVKAWTYQTEIEQAVTQMNISFDADNSTYRSERDAAGFQILGRLTKIQTAVQMLKVKEENCNVHKFQAKTYLTHIEKEVNRTAISANVDSSTYTSERDAIGFQILGCLSKIQTAVREMKAKEEKSRKELEIYMYAFNTFSNGWKLKGQNIYYFSTKEENWQDAEKFCVSQKSHLTSITTSEEQQYLTAESGDYWFGLTDAGSEGNWRFVDGSKFLQSSPRFWAVQQPDNWQKNEHCAHITPKGQWNDVACAAKKKWICKTSVPA